MSRFLLITLICLVASQQVWANGLCGDSELDLCDNVASQQVWANGLCGGSELDLCGNTEGSKCGDPELDLCDDNRDSQCQDSELDLCDNKDGDDTTPTLQIHMFEGASCAKATSPATKSIEMNKCTSIDMATVKITEKDANSIYLMLGETGCSDGEGTWGTGKFLDCKKDVSECCEVSVDEGGAIMFSYKVGPPASLSPMPAAAPTPVPMPVPVPVPAPTPSPTPTPNPQDTETAADTAHDQTSAVLLASAGMGVGALLLHAP